MWLSLAIVTTLAAILGTTGQATAAAKPISSCGYSITTGGTAISPAQYILTQDLSCSNSDGIDISAKYVTVNLNGYRITGPGTFPPPNSPYYGNFYGIFVYAGGSNRLSGITITGPTPGLSSIQNFSYGIELDNVDNSTVQNVVLSNNLYGLSTDLRDQVNNWVSGLKILCNTATLNGFTGIGLWNSIGSTISGNIAVGNAIGTYIPDLSDTPPNGGIMIWHGRNNLVTLNNSNGNVLDGIDIYASTDNNVTLNTASGNGRVGITVFSDSSANTLSQNSAEGNLVYDLQDYDASPPCGTNTWSADWYNSAYQPCDH